MPGLCGLFDTAQFDVSWFDCVTDVPNKAPIITTREVRDITDTTSEIIKPISGKVEINKLTVSTRKEKKGTQSEKEEVKSTVTTSE